MSEFRITLFELKTPAIKVIVEAFFEGDSLVVEGYDIGKTVKEYWGDSDYEYNFKVTPENTVKVFALFEIAPTEKMALLNKIASRYNTNSCYSSLQNLLDDAHISYESFSWS